jgi:hypothetical protein
MLYPELLDYLKNRLSLDPPCIGLPELGQKVMNFGFISQAASLLRHTEGKAVRPDLERPGLEGGGASGILRDLYLQEDASVAENASFRYHLFLPQKSEKAEDLIILLHGLNERSWAKYFPWAARLVELTGRGVLLFPLAFHVNRSPASWSEPRAMRSLSRFRQSLHPGLLGSSLSNAALSARLSADPSRFFWSGLQTLKDLGSLVSSVRQGLHPGVDKAARADFFTYSIGTFLGLIVLMADEGGLFGDSRFVAFCGGPVFNRLSPVSKFIMDSQASLDLYSFMVERLESRLKSDPALAERLGGDYPEGRFFRSFLNYRLERACREERLKALSSRVLAVTMAKDEVVPPFEVVNTLKGADRDIGIEVRLKDPPYPYRHEDPFPPLSKEAQAVDRAFGGIFEEGASFLSGKG